MVQLLLNRQMPLYNTFNSSDMMDIVKMRVKWQTGPTVAYTLPDCLRDPAVDSEQFRRDLKIVSVRWTLEAIVH